MNLSKKPLAMAYVPWQTFENVMEGEMCIRDRFQTAFVSASADTSFIHINFHMTDFSTGTFTAGQNFSL